MAENSKLVLVAENDKLWRQSLIQLLEDLGYQTLPADSGFMAQERLLRFKKIDLVISSIVLPDLSGPDLMIWERKTFSKEDEKRPFIFISGITNSPETQRAKDLGCSLFLTRPIDEDFLADALLKIFKK